MAPLKTLLLRLWALRPGAGGARREDDDGRVLQLFRNRAELKKSYSALQDEVRKTKDRIKQQEGATARVQEMLQGLEARLSEPDTGYPALVFYQLRELWSLGRTLVTQLVADLSAQQEEIERRQFFAEHNRKLFDRRQALEGALREQETRVADARQAASDIEQQILRLRQFWHYFKRRALRQQLQAAGLKTLLTQQDLEGARQARDVLEAEPTPEFPGLSLEARRAINLAAIAFGQVLCDRLARTQLLQLAREAGARREPPREQYGDRARCEATMAEIQRARVALQQRTNLPQEIQQWSGKLRELAKYRATTDTLPVPEGLAIAVGGSNVLSEDLWEIYRALLR